MKVVNYSAETWESQLSEDSRFSANCIRSQPSFDADEIGFLSPGTQFVVTERRGDWLCFHHNGQTGWSVIHYEGVQYLNPVAGESVEYSIKFYLLDGGGWVHDFDPSHMDTRTISIITGGDPCFQKDKHAIFRGEIGVLTMDPNNDGDVKLEWVNGKISDFINIQYLGKPTVDQIWQPTLKEGSFAMHDGKLAVLAFAPDRDKETKLIYVNTPLVDSVHTSYIPTDMLKKPTQLNGSYYKVDMTMAAGD
jgi:hypothetical protein